MNRLNDEQIYNLNPVSLKVINKSHICASFIVIMLLSAVPTFSQEVKLTESIISVAEQLAGDEDDPEAAAIFTEKLNELAEDPVSVNSADENEISRLFFLTDFQVKALADYSHSSGKIISVYEIANIPGFDRETTEMMIPFITFDSQPLMKIDSNRFHSTLLTNISFRTGSKDSLSVGSPYKVLSKYKLTSGPVTIGFTAEKDAGEKLFSKGKTDFFSSYLSYRGKGIVRRFIIGDYTARFGQGLNVNTGLRTGISLTAQGYMSAGSDIRQYTSTDENRFFRGMAAGFSLGKLDIDIFYSFNKIDATITSSEGNADNHAESLYTAGLHSTDQLLQKKDVISLQTYGANLTFDLGNTRLGLVLTRDKFSLPLRKDEPEPRNIFDFSGDCNLLYSLYYSSVINKILLFGEFSVNDSMQYAFIQGASLRMSGRLTINLLLRNYNEGYYSFHGKGPGSSTSWNETGFTGNFSFEAAKNLFMIAGAEIRHYPWLRYRCSSPSTAIKKEIRLRYNPSDDLNFETLYNYSMSVTDDPQSENKILQNENKTRSFRGSVSFSPSQNFTVGTRIDYKSFNHGESEGMLMFQDACYTFNSIPLSLWFRYCLFRTESWDSRIYAYENDILNSFSIPSLAGEGSRSYLMLKWKISSIGEIRIRYGFTSVGEENQGDIKFQLKLNF